DARSFTVMPSSFPRRPAGVSRRVCDARSAESCRSFAARLTGRCGPPGRGCGRTALGRGGGLTLFRQPRTAPTERVESTRMPLNRRQEHVMLRPLRLSSWLQAVTESPAILLCSWRGCRHPPSPPQRPLSFMFPPLRMDSPWNSRRIMPLTPRTGGDPGRCARKRASVSLVPSVVRLRGALGVLLDRGEDDLSAPVGAGVGVPHLAVPGVDADVVDALLGAADEDQVALLALAGRHLGGLVVLALGGARQLLAVLLVGVVRQARAVEPVGAGGSVAVRVTLLGGGGTERLRPYRGGGVGIRGDEGQGEAHADDGGNRELGDLVH